MAEFDPIANISRFSPTKHLQGQAASTSSALQKLMSGRLIQSDRDIAQGQRQKASDLSRLTGTLAPHGLSPGGLTPNVLERIKGQIGAERGGRTVADLVKGGWRYGKGIGPTRPGDIYQKEATPGHLLPGVAMRREDLKAIYAQGKKKKTIGIVPPGPGQIGFQKEEITTEDKLTTSAKNTKQAKALVEKALGSAGSYDRLIKSAKIKYPEAREIVANVAPNGKIYIYVDGGDPIPVNP